MEEYFSFYASLIDEILKMNNEGIRVVEHSASIHLKRIFNPGFSGYADLKSPSGVVLNSILSIMTVEYMVAMRAVCCRR